MTTERPFADDRLERIRLMAALAHDGQKEKLEVWTDDLCWLYDAFVGREQQRVEEVYQAITYQGGPRTGEIDPRKLAVFLAERADA